MQWSARSDAQANTDFDKKVVCHKEEPANVFSICETVMKTRHLLAPKLARVDQAVRARRWWLGGIDLVAVDECAGVDEIAVFFA
jgi:hypothetical protein